MTERRIQREKDHTEDVLWVMGLTAAMMLAAAGFLSAAGVLPLARLAQPCLLRQLTGFYCPGCGGTRAAIHLVHGHLFRSFFYHPAVPVGGLLGAAFLISQTASRLSGGRIPRLHYRAWFGYVILALVAASFLIKNAALLMGAAWW